MHARDNEPPARLDRAVFRLDEPGLVPGVPRCLDCRRRSGNAPLLCPKEWGPLACLDASCFALKTEAQVARNKTAIARLRAQLEARTSEVA